METLLEKDYQQLNMGVAVEKEHMHTYNWVKKYFGDRGEVPAAYDFFLHIAEDHLVEDKEYYSKLKAAKL
jgi:hypothetical protein